MIEAQARDTLHLDGWLVTPPFVDPHFHLDSTLSAGRPRVNRSGTLLEGIEIWADLAPTLTADDVKHRARALCHWSIAMGVGACSARKVRCFEITSTLEKTSGYTQNGLP